MFQTITDVQNAEVINLQQCIDNRRGDLLISLRSIMLTVGWYNTTTNEGFGRIQNGVVTATRLPMGLWGFEELRTFIDTEFTDFASINICKANGLITLTVKREKITMSPDMSDILGITKTYNDNRGWLEPGNYIGDTPVAFALTKTLWVHLDQLNTSNNICDGAPSTLLKVINAGNAFFGEPIIIDYPQQEFKHLERGYIN